MKIQELAYQVAMRTMSLLEETHHYNIPDASRKEVAQKILEELGDMIKKS